MLHVSIDDVFPALIQASQTGRRLFDHPFFAFLRELHNQHSIEVDLYLFYEGEVAGIPCSLQEVSDRFKLEFQQSPWLRLGPHGLNTATPPYEQTLAEQQCAFDRIYSEIERFAGSDNLSTLLRLHYFSESFDLDKYWFAKGVTALYFTDKPAASYHLPEQMVCKLKKHGVVTYSPQLQIRRSHFRIENLVNLDAKEISRAMADTLNQFGFVSVFSHEYECSSEQVRNTFHTTLTELRQHVPA